jgi:two-component system LytT family response regulator
MLKTIIIDDEKLAIESLQWEIENFCDNIKVEATFSNPIDAIEGINTIQPDLVFLDIEMPEIDGFQLLQKLHYKNFDLIITTAYNQYAIQAFRANAIDYLLKPIDPDELVEAINKVKNRKGSGNENRNIETILDQIIAKQSKYPKIPLSLSSKVVLVDPENIIYCKSEGSYTRVFMKEKEKLLVSKSIKTLENLCPSEKFMRVHKSYIVNIDEIQEYLRQGGGELVLSNGMVIPVSRTHKNEVLEALNIH